MQPSFRRITVATLAFIVACLPSTVRILSESPSPANLPLDTVGLQSDVRFAAVKSALPHAGVVGYIGETGELADYYLAQYALAPLVVDRSANHSLVVVNFPDTPPPAPALPLLLVTDFGHGVLLYANKDAR